MQMMILWAFSFVSFVRVMVGLAMKLPYAQMQREEGQEEDSDSPAVTQLQGRWGKNVTPFPWASKSVLFCYSDCYSDSSITKQRHF